MDAMQRGDVDAMVSMLAGDAEWSIRRSPGWFHGRDALIGFMRMGLYLG